MGVFPETSLSGVRQQARIAPAELLSHHPKGVVVDEAQRAPQLLQEIAERASSLDTPGRVRFVLPMSWVDDLVERMLRDLGGRAIAFTLCPFSYLETRHLPATHEHIYDWLFRGFFGPAFVEEGGAARRWLAGYIKRAVDGLQSSSVKPRDPTRFDDFLASMARHNAGRVRHSALSRAARISVPTARRWFGALEANHLVWRQPAWSPDIGRRLVSAPRLHFVDMGLTSRLLGVHDPSELIDHPMRGRLFDSFVVNEIRKCRLHRGLAPNLHHVCERRASRLRVPAVSDLGSWVVLTSALLRDDVGDDALAQMRWLEKLLRPALGERNVELRIVYAGRTARIGGGVHVLPVTHIGSRDW